jgi:glycosyltransferase involved in cell wall biosynthesis
MEPTELTRHQKSALVSSRPSISVIVPSYNQGRYIERTIRSVLNQPYGGSIELIVSDGGSTDETTDVLKRYPGVLWWSERDRGFSDAVNKGLKKASGEIVAIQSSDDFYLEGAFETVARQFLKFPEMGIVSGCDINLDETGRIIRVMRSSRIVDSPRFVLTGGYTPQHCTFMRRNWIEHIGGLKESTDMCGDSDLIYRLLHFTKGLYIRGLIGVNQIHAAQRTRRSADLWIDAEKRMVLECESDPFFSDRFRCTEKEKEEYFLRSQIYWSWQAGDLNKTAECINKFNENRNVRSDWLRRFIDPIGKKLEGRKRTVFERLFTGSIAVKCQRKIDLIIAERTIDIRWWMNEWPHAKSRTVFESETQNHKESGVE